MNQGAGKRVRIAAGILVIMLAVSFIAAIRESRHGYVADRGYMVERNAQDKAAMVSIRVPEGTKKIGTSAFSGCTNLKRVELPEGLEEIGQSAFSGCCSLVEIELPGRVREIGSAAFSGCSSLKEMRIPEEVIEIEDRTFEDCTALGSVALPKSLQKISSKAFGGCVNLKSIEIPPGVTEIESNAFLDCTNLKNVDLSPERVWKIGAGAFGGTPWFETLETDEYGCIYIQDILMSFGGERRFVKVREGTRMIAGDAFRERGVEKVELPEGLISIGGLAFYQCFKLKSVELPDSIQSVGWWAFEETEWLDSLKADEYGCKYEGKYLLKIMEDTSGTVKIREGTELIADSAGWGAFRLNKLELPQSLKKIGVSTFRNCYRLENVVLREGLEEIGDRAFYDTGMKKVRIPKSVQRVGSDAFSACGKLKKIWVPEHLRDSFSYDGKGRAIYY